MASYQAFLSSLESRTFEKPGMEKQHSPLGLRLPKMKVNPFRLRAPAYDSEPTMLPNEWRTPAVNWSETGGLVSLAMRKTSGFPDRPVAMMPFRPATLMKAGSQTRVGCPSRGRPSAE